MVAKALAWLTGRRLVLLAVTGATVVLAMTGRSELARKERELVFRIEPGTASWYTGLPRGVQEFNLPFSTPGGVQRIHSWWWPAAARNAPAVLYLHGSRWNLTGQLFRISQLHDFGFSVLAIDYRGFGKSEGELPSENSVYADARAAWDYLTELQSDPARRFIYGHSLGGAVAVDLAHALSSEAQHAGRAVPAAGLIVESSFTSLAQLAAELTATRWPIRWLLSQKFNSIDKIAAVHLPVLFVHGSDDRYVPARFSEALYDAATEPKRLLLVAQANHNNSMRLGSADYGKALRELFGLGKQTGKATDKA